MKRLLFCTGLYVCTLLFLNPVTTIAQQVSIKASEVKAPLAHELLRTRLRSWKLYQLSEPIEAPSLATQSVLLQLGTKQVLLVGAHQGLTDENSRLVALGTTGRAETQFPDLLYFISDQGRLTIGNDFIQGEISEDGSTTLIEKLANLVPGVHASLLVVYKATDVVANNRVACNVKERTIELSTSRNNRPQEPMRTTGACRVVDIGVLVNSSTYMIHGSSLETTAAYITSIYLLTEGDYTGAFNDDLKFKINEMIISTSESTDPWPWTFDIELGITMDLFSSWAVTGFHAPNDLTSYWFNDGLSGGNIGWGQLGQTCHINGDAVLREEGSAQTMRCLLSHEHGHNFNALHDAEGSAYIMAPIIKAGHLKFSSTSKAAINNHLASSAADCISACTFTECERMGPRNLSIRYDSAQAGILCTWENESAGMGHIIQWWVLGDTILNSDTAAAIDTSFFIRISDNPACRVYKVQVAKFCSPGVAGWFMAPISITVGNKITPQPFITAINNVLYSSADTGNQWFLDGAAIPGATGISHVTRSSGSYSVQATVQGCSSPMSDPYYHIFRSVNYSPLEAQFIIAPNPVRDKLLIRNAGPSPSYMLTVYDIIGRKVFASSVFSASYTLNMKTFRAGIYIILIDIHQSGERIKRRVLKE